MKKLNFLFIDHATVSLKAVLKAGVKRLQRKKT